MYAEKFDSIRCVTEIHTFLFHPNLDYQLLRLGKSGYRAIMTNLISTADYLAESIAAFGDGEKFVLMSKTGGEGLPLVAWRLKNNENYDGKHTIPVFQHPASHAKIK